MPPAEAATPGVSGRANPALGRDGQLRTPSTSATAQASVLPTASGGAGAGRPTAEVTGAPSSAVAGSAGPGPNPSASASASATDSASGTPGAGTLSVSPATLNVTPPASGSITLTASGGDVNWSVSEPSGLENKVVVAPMSGTLAAGQSTT